MPDEILSTPARRRTAIVLAAGGAAIVVLLLAAAWAERHAKSLLVHALSVRTGRQVRIEGDLGMHLLTLHPRAEAQAVSVGNPAWMPGGTTAEADRVRLGLAWCFAAPPLRVERLEVDGARLHLARDADGHANWLLREEGPGRGAPLMRSVSIPDAHVELHDQRRHVDFVGVASAGDAPGAGAAPALQIEAHGQLNGRPVRLTLTGDALAQARSDQPYHFSLEERSGTTRLTGKGEVLRPFDLRELRGDFAVEGPDLRTLYYLVGLRFPRSGPFALTGHFERHTMHYAYSRLRLSTGVSDLSGAVDIQAAPPGGRARFVAQLSSTRLRLADVGPRAGAGESTAPEVPADRLRVPQTLLPTAALKDSEAKLTYHARALEVGALALRDVEAQGTLERGVLTVTGLQGQLLGGALTGKVRLYAGAATPRAEADVSVVGADLDQLPAREGKPRALGGALSTRVQLHGTGDSWHALAASADGRLTLVMPHGTVRAALAEAAGGELAGAIGLMTKAPGQVEVRCGVLSLTATQGVFRADPFVMDTESVLITGGGEAHMDTEALDFWVRGRPKMPTLRLRSAVAVRGTLSRPQFSLGAGGATAQAGAAVALGVVLSPLASVLAFVSPGLAHDADCQGLLAQPPSPQAP